MVTAVVVAAVVLGPALGPGVVLAYDLVWSPDPRWTPFSLGVGTPAPRAVPSDAAAVLLGHLVTAPVAQKLVLWGVLALAGLGTARLARFVRPGLGGWGAAVAALAGVWNPFVLERLLVGQWTVLLGYAAVPYLLVATARLREDPARPALPLAAGVALCGVGGANTLLLALAATVPVLLWPRPRWRALALVLLGAVGAAAAWALPATASGVRTTVVGVEQFAPRADTPFGTGLSLLLGGGFWNPATHSAERTSWLVAAVALVAVLVSLVAADHALRRSGHLVLAVPAFVGLVVAALAALDPLGGWTALVTHVPGMAVLRDAQKLVAPLVVVAAAGAGVAVQALAGGNRARPAGPALAVLLTAVPVLTLPSLAWGAGGRLVAVDVPADVRAGTDRLSAAPEGLVGVLPWGQYRRYAWNDSRVSLSLAPRMVDQRLLADDSLPLSTGRVPGEDAAAARVTAAVAAGTDPGTALRAEGVRYLLVERRAGGTVSSAVPPGSDVLVDDADLLVIDLAPGSDPVPVTVGALATVGWGVTLTTLAAAATALTVSAWRPRRAARGVGYPVVESAP